jgi:hypothetical protein
MAIRFLATGVIEADTVPEAIEWERRKIPAPKPRGRPRKTRHHPAGTSPWDRFCDLIQGPSGVRMRKILTLVKGRGETGIDIRELSTALKDQSANNIGGLLAGFVQKAKKSGVGYEDLIFRGPDGRFRPGNLLQTHDPPIP